MLLKEMEWQVDVGTVSSKCFSLINKLENGSKRLSIRAIFFKTKSSHFEFIWSDEANAVQGLNE